MKEALLKNKFHEACDSIIKEIHYGICQVNPSEINAFIALIESAHHIFCFGSGRSGLILQTFCMRLNHLGLKAFWVGSIDCPPATPDDALLVCSASGKTASVLPVMQNAKIAGAKIGVITTAKNNESTNFFDAIVHINAPFELINEDKKSKQPMKTLFEQTAFILCESIISLLQKRNKISEEEMARRHSNLE
jgi:6-phospho-3-hexuloisomerase